MTDVKLFRPDIHDTIVCRNVEFAHIGVNPVNRFLEMFLMGNNECIPFNQSQRSSVFEDEVLSNGDGFYFSCVSL